MENRPEYLTDEMLVHLDNLHNGKNLDVINTVYHMAEEFPRLNVVQRLNDMLYAIVLGYWLGTFAERHNKENENGS